MTPAQRAAMRRVGARVQGAEVAPARGERPVLPVAMVAVGVLLLGVAPLLSVALFAGSLAAGAGREVWR